MTIEERLAKAVVWKIFKLETYRAGERAKLLRIALKAVKSCRPHVDHAAVSFAAKLYWIQQERANEQRLETIANEILGNWQ